MMKERTAKGEKIGGGFWIFKRGLGGRISPSVQPFEHPNYEAALTEAKRLAALTPGVRFLIVGEEECIMVAVEEETTPKDG